MKWWAYEHLNGEIVVKRFFEMRDIHETMEGGFCRGWTIGPFEALNREAASKVALRRRNGQQ